MLIYNKLAVNYFMIKTALGLILVCFLSIYSNAQQIVYQPMHGSVTYWEMYYAVYTFQLEDYYGHTYCSGDTIINGNTYNKIYGGSQNGLYYGGFREDILNQQRFFIDTQGVEWNISINQFLEVGDTLLNMAELKKAFALNGGAPDLDLSDTLIVVEKDSVMELNGNYSVTYTFSIINASEWDSGEDRIVYNAVTGMESYEALEHVNFLQGYSTGFAGINHNYREELTVSPNPSTGKFQLSGFEEKQLVYTITDVYGNELITNATNPEIDLSLQPSGCYFVLFSDVDRKISSLKILKQ